MEALLHYAPVSMPVPAPRQQGAVIGASAALQQVSAVTAQKPPAGAGREQCPRCASWDTKFCYYNNYNTAQPRHFCRACRRYWTLGGSLRNVPVGGSTRKRPRPARRPTRAIAAALADASSSAGTAAGAATTPSSSLCGPFAASPVPSAAAVAAQNVGLLRSLLLGSVPLLEGRLGLGQPAASTGASDDLAQLGVSTGTPLWPVAGMEGDRATETTWKSGGVFPPTTAMWQELAAATGAGMPPRLL